ISSIPRPDGERWVYPSEAQFFAAMARKQHDPAARDMRVIVPIHNAVNERAWAEVLRWERAQGGERCGGVKLVSFKGRPGDLTPRARWRSLIGYARPFDRHDWIVDRCGTRVRYVIDFYTGKSQGPSNTPSFYLDVRPALDNWEGVRMRMQNFCQRWF
ncbi:cytochrome c and c1 heme-lyase, partial [Gloeophyllum trabeum ATCC 11539]